ncbi:MAG TPA: amidohydrolase family protein [Thermoanaerobaculia bacterium]
MKNLLFLTLLAAATLEARPIAFTNVNVIPMTSDAVLRKQVVIVDDEKIVSVESADTAKIPEGAEVIDGEGGYLIPGLTDLHVHVNEPDDLSLYVVHGVTTVLNLAGDTSTLRLRRRPFGASLFTAGPLIIDVQTAAAARQVVEENAKAGYDAIKIYDNISAEALPVLVAEARKRGLLAVGHIPRNRTWQEMLAARPDAIAHAEEFLYSPVLEGDDAKIVSGMKDGGISLITTLITYDTIGRQVADPAAMLARSENAYVNPIFRRMWVSPRNRYLSKFQPARVPKFRSLLAFQKGLVKQLEDGGVRILAGTDAGGVPFVVPGVSLIDELRELVSCGLKPYDVMRATTVDAAHFLRRDAGTIEAGKPADLVLLRGNPLADIDNITLRAGVMLRGRWLDNAALHAELDRLIAINHREEAIVEALDHDGVRAAIAVARRIGARESSLNELAYQLLRAEKRRDDAIQVFRANVAMHPDSEDARDSLADAIASR